MEEKTKKRGFKITVIVLLSIITLLYAFNTFMDYTYYSMMQSKYHNMDMNINKMTNDIPKLDDNLNDIRSTLRYGTIDVNLYNY